MKPVKGRGFNGMANVKETPAYLLDEKRRITPQFVLNANVQDDGRVVRRMRRRLIINLPGIHSLWAKTVMLGVAPGEEGTPALYRFEGYKPQEVGNVGGPIGTPMEYVEVNRKIYLSNGFWSGAYDLRTGVLGAWGMPLPPLPHVTFTAGNLPPGVYKLCYTYFEEPNRLSGNGPLVEVAWSGGSMGLVLNGKPSNALAWITQPNGKELYLATVNGGVISEPYYTQPLPSFGVQAPPSLRALCLGHGRLWGAVEGKLYYSEEFQYEWFRPSGYLPFPEDIVMTVPVNRGLFVNSLETTWFLAGTNPGKMTVEKMGTGALPGTLTSVLVESIGEGIGYEFTRKLARILMPAWATRAGLVVGTYNGELVHLTEGKLRINPRSRGAAFYQNLRGQPLALFSLSGPVKGAVDPEISAINSRGRLYIPEPAELVLTGGVTIGGEGEYT